MIVHPVCTYECGASHMSWKPARFMIRHDTSPGTLVQGELKPELLAAKRLITLDQQVDIHPAWWIPVEIALEIDCIMPHFYGPSHWANRSFIRMSANRHSKYLKYHFIRTPWALCDRAYLLGMTFGWGSANTTPSQRVSCWEYTSQRGLIWTEPDASKILLS